MSEIRANLISDAPGTGPAALFKQSAAKVVSNINGTSATSLFSLNVSSIVDVGAGTFDRNFTSAFASASYADSSTSNETNSLVSNGNKTASVQRQITQNSSHVSTDAAVMGYQAFGDLA